MLFMCSARARRCRAQCDVLVIPQLVTILPHIFLSHFCPCCCCYCCCCCCCCSCSCSFLVVAAGGVVGVVGAVVVFTLLLVVVLVTQLNFRIFVDP